MKSPEELRRNLLKIIRETEQLVADKRWWNANRTDAQPFDLGHELSLLKVARAALVAADAGDWKTHLDLSNEMVRITRGARHAER